MGEAIRGNLGQLQQTGHPKWKEVKLDDKVGVWPLDRCSRSGKSGSKSGGKSGGSGTDINRELEKMLLNQYEWPRYLIPAA